MSFPKPRQRIPDHVGELRVQIREAPDGEGGFEYKARAFAEILNAGGQRVDSIGADIIPLLAQQDKEDLLRILFVLRSLAEEQIDPNDG